MAGQEDCPTKAESVVSPNRTKIGIQNAMLLLGFGHSGGPGCLGNLTVPFSVLWDRAARLDLSLPKLTVSSA